ncbi:MAG: Membrane protein [Microbacteriaceae bacterium]|nr:Membrane protein [Microbacteriaceae bacterium]
MNARRAVDPRSGQIGRFLLVRYRLTPWWLRVVVIWAISRVVTTAMMLVFAYWQKPSYWAGAHPNYFQFAQFWDSGWYHTVATSGYPTVLPMNGAHVADNAWAFLPAYPAVVRVLMDISGAPWEFVSVFVSVAFSLAGAIAFYRLMRLVLPSSTAMFSVVLLCVAPLSPIMQVAYAESMHAFFLTLSLYFLLRRRYLVMMPAVAVMALTRPSGLAFALLLALHFGYRWFTRKRDPFPLREMLKAGGATVFSLLVGLAWPLIAWIATGSPSAYTDTELAWRASYIGYGELMPFSAWIDAARFWVPGYAGVFALFLLVALFVVALFLPPVKRLGVDLRLWLVSYALYLLAVFFPQSSTFRLLIPMSPLLGAIAQPRSRIYRVTVVVVALAAQWCWIYLCWWSSGYDWTPP